GIGLLRQGLSLDEGSRRIGSHASSVFRWREAYLQSGRQGLKARPLTGRPRKLVARDLGRLVQLLNECPRPHGDRPRLCTPALIAKLIRRHFGVRYHRDHIGRLMASLNWAYKKPVDGTQPEEQSAVADNVRYQESPTTNLVQGWVPLCGGSKSSQFTASGNETSADGKRA